MNRQEIRDYLAAHPFFQDLDDKTLDAVVQFASERQVAMQHRVFKQDSDANEFYIVLEGNLAVEIPSVFGDPAIIQPLEPGDVVGWSWLVPPHRWRFDARAYEDSRLLVIDGRRLREHCEADPAVGYALLKRFARLMTQRLEGARQRVIETYQSAL